MPLIFAILSILHDANIVVYQENEFSTYNKRIITEMFNTEKLTDRIKVEIKVQKGLLGYPGSPSQYYVAVVGSGPQLGLNNLAIAPRCARISNNIWKKEIWVPEDSWVSFKFLIVHGPTNKVFEVEKVSPRYIHVKNEAVQFHTKFNEADSGDRKVRSERTEQTVEKKTNMVQGEIVTGKWNSKEKTEEGKTKEQTEEQTPKEQTEEQKPNGQTEEQKPNGQTEEQKPKEQTDEQKPNGQSEEHKANIRRDTKRTDRRRKNRRTSKRTKITGTGRRTKAKARTEKYKTEEEEKQEKKLKEQTKEQKLKEQTEKQKPKEETEKQKPKEETEEQNLKEQTEKQKLKERTEKQKLKERTEEQKLKEQTDEQRPKEETEEHNLKEQTEQQKLKEQTKGQKLKEQTDEQKLKKQTKEQNLKEQTEEKKTRGTNIITKTKAQTEKYKTEEEKKQEQKRKGQIEEQKLNEQIKEHSLREQTEEQKVKEQTEEQKPKEQTKEQNLKKQTVEKKRKEKTGEQKQNKQTGKQNQGEQAKQQKPKEQTDKQERNNNRAGKGNEKFVVKKEKITQTENCKSSYEMASDGTCSQDKGGDVVKSKDLQRMADLHTIREKIEFEKVLLDRGDGQTIQPYVHQSVLVDNSFRPQNNKKFTQRIGFKPSHAHLLKTLDGIFPQYLCSRIPYDSVGQCYTRRNGAKYKLRLEESEHWKILSSKFTKSYRTKNTALDILKESEIKAEITHVLNKSIDDNQKNEITEKGAEAVGVATEDPSCTWKFPFNKTGLIVVATGIAVAACLKSFVF